MSKILQLQKDGFYQSQEKCFNYGLRHFNSNGQFFHFITWWKCVWRWVSWARVKYLRKKYQVFFDRFQPGEEVNPSNWLHHLIGLILILTTNFLVIGGIIYNIDLLLIPWLIAYTVGKSAD